MLRQLHQCVKETIERGHLECGVSQLEYDVSQRREKQRDVVEVVGQSHCPGFLACFLAHGARLHSTNDVHIQIMRL